MGFFKKLFGKPEKSPDANMGDYIEKLQTATPNVLAFVGKSWLEFDRNGSGKPVGFWLAKHPPGDQDTFLKAAASFLKAAEGELSQQHLDLLYLGDYKLVPNTKDDRGGFHVVIG